jgi:hypothetical protein
VSSLTYSNTSLLTLISTSVPFVINSPPHETVQCSDQLDPFKSCDFKTPQ